MTDEMSRFTDNSQEQQNRNSKCWRQLTTSNKHPLGITDIFQMVHEMKEEHDRNTITAAAANTNSDSDIGIAHIRAMGTWHNSRCD